MNLRKSIYSIGSSASPEKSGLDRKSKPSVHSKLKINKMKKLILLAGLYCLHPNLNAAPRGVDAKYRPAPTSATARAMAHFKENYAWVQDADWFNTVENNMYCVFHQGNIVNRVFYDQYGYWQYTLISFPPSVLPKNVKKIVSENFDGYTISYVNEILSINDEPVYMINIENGDDIKVVRVSGDAIEVKQDIKKR
jgi:hypothetical protein